MSNYCNKSWKKDKDATLFYIFDFKQKTNKTGYDEDYLMDGESLSNVEIIVSGVDDLLNVESYEIQNGNSQVLVLLSGGTNTLTYDVTARIETNLGQKDDITQQIDIQEK